MGSDSEPTPAGEASGVSDVSLLRRFRSGEEDAATELYKKYAQRLIEMTQRNTGTDLRQRFDAEDVVQSVFRTFFRRTFEGHYQVPPGEQLWQLLLTIALNKLRLMANHHRAQKRDVGATVGSAEIPVDRLEGESQDETSLYVLQQAIEESLQDLTEANRQIVRMRIDGFKTQEIADRTDRSLRTVERVLRQYREHLSQLLDISE